MTQKRLLVPDRVRRPPREGFSWIDRSFLREFAVRLKGDAILLYFFLAAVSDQWGLSFNGDESVAARLRMSDSRVANAWVELSRFDLIAYAPPLTQMLSLPTPRVDRGDAASCGGLFPAPPARSQR